MAALLQASFQVLGAVDFVFEKDLSEIPANIQQELVIHFVESMDEVLNFALERKLETQPVPAPEGERSADLESTPLGEGRDRLTN